MNESPHDRVWGSHPAVTTGSDCPLGQRAADRMKATLATWTALACMGLFIGVWMIVNSHIGGKHFDPYPWILLNLMLSTLAGLQCFVLLIANKRGEQIAAEIAVHTVDNTEDIKTLVAANTELTEAVKKDTTLLEEIHAHVSGQPGRIDP
jgi:uncharacterized membrane protein